MNTEQVKDELAQVLNYHEATKHHFQQYARGPQFLDWDDQPNPFRRFQGAPLHPLQHIELTNEPPYDAAFINGQCANQALNITSLSQLFYDSLALSAWKQAGEARWSLRVNPSSGNLHPTEAYLLCGAVEGLHHKAGIYHYAPKEHGLEQRAELTEAAWQNLSAGFPEGSFFIGLSSIHWREMWKYGERAFRYCQHDIGHAIAAISVAANALGWHTTLLDGLGTEELVLLMGLEQLREGREAEHPDCLLAITPTPIAKDVRPDPAAVQACAKLQWTGDPNQLSPEHLRWRIIEHVTIATHKAALPVEYPSFKADAAQLPTEDQQAPFGIRPIIHRRRSAVSMDGRTGITADAFFQILRKTMPLENQLPFSALPWSPQVNLILLVHRVKHLKSGLYVLLRDPNGKEQLQAALKPEFTWAKPAVCPDDLPFFQLAEGDGQQLAKQLSCHQSIASDGCFAVSMLANFRPVLEEVGAWFYPRLFWETGLIGQVLYLEAEASGVAGTGIGCFFDDPVHESLGLSGNNDYQTLYHFTIGGRVEDSRLLTLPPYDMAETK